MDIDDFAEPEVGVAVALTAIFASPKVRHYVRKGLVYGVAGALSLTDAAKEVVHGVKKTVTSLKPSTSTEPGITHD